MKFNKFWAVFFFCLVIFSVVVMAEDGVVLDQKNLNGDPSFDWMINQLGFIDRLKLSGNRPLTIVGGALCSSFSDRSGDFVAGSSKSFCFTNNNHIGVAVQLFQKNPWGFISEKQLLRDDKKCYYGLTEGASYHWDAYYCDDLSKSCSDYVSECQDGSRTLRVRVCTEGSTRTTEKTWVDWVAAGAPKCSISGTGTGVIVKEPILTTPVENNDGDSKTSFCNNKGFDSYAYVSQDFCNKIISRSEWTSIGCCIDDSSSQEQGGEGGETIPPPPPTNLKGTWTDINHPTNIDKGESFKVTARFTAEQTGTYLLESGHSFKEPLSISLSKSACDNNEHYASQYFTLQNGESIELEFNLVGYTETGIYDGYVGAFTGCMVDASGNLLPSAEQGQSIVMEPFKLNILDRTNNLGFTTPNVFSGINDGAKMFLFILGVITTLVGIVLSFMGVLSIGIPFVLGGISIILAVLGLGGIL
jgi:hypothetical protein